MHGGRQRIVMVLGAGRSGSTLLSRIAGTDPSLAAVGEVASLVDQHGVTCGCGLQPAACPIWSPVVTRLLDDESQEDFLRSLRPPKLVQMLAFAGFPVVTRQRRRDFSVLFTRIYDHLFDRLSVDEIVDESKSPWLAFGLAHYTDYDIHVVEVIRRPEQVVASWATSKPHPGSPDGYFPTRTPTAVLRRWTMLLLLHRLLERRMPGWSTVMFEDMIDDPAAVFGQFGIKPQISRRHADGSAHFQAGENHIFASNPDKYARGDVSLRAPLPHERRESRPSPWMARTADRLYVAMERRSARRRRHAG